MKKKAILCVDDEVLILYSIKEELKSHFREKFIYETALNAKEALSVIDALEKENIQLSLVISDWLMPGTKGDELLTIIKGKHPDIKTILITGQASDEAMEKLKRDNITDFVLVKPWAEADLISSAEKCVSVYVRPCIPD